jgi:hypothetical protein
MTKSDAKRENDEMPETLLFSALTTRDVENRPVDAALKLGGDGPFRNVPPQFGYWLVPAAGAVSAPSPRRGRTASMRSERQREFMGRVGHRVRHRFILPMAGGSN